MDSEESSNVKTMTGALMPLDRALGTKVYNNIAGARLFFSINKGLLWTKLAQSDSITENVHTPNIFANKRADLPENVGWTHIVRVA